jgi:glycosyltransferase involved in cell wall biosynthesis
LIWRLARLFRRERIDIVHTHDDKPLVYGMPAAWRAGVRRRIHTHHHGHVASVTRRQDRLVAWVARLCQHFVCVSEDSARHLIATGVPANRVIVQHNGIDLSRFPYQGPRLDGPVVTVARLSPEKDIASLLRAARLAANQMPALRFEIAGEGPCREELLQLSQELRLSPHVRFLGEVREVPALLARARLFTLPSQAEGISLTILEAMARGLPVVATQVGGNSEVVVPEQTGLLVPPRDPAALAEAIIRLWRDPEEGRCLGQAGRQRVEDHFDVRQMIAGYEALYEPRPREVAQMALSDFRV